MRTIQDMWRAALALLLVSGTACGKKTDDGAAAVATAPAGTVIEINGGVTAGSRTLRAGDVVAADDEIATAGDGRVTIELAHNGARWTLGPNQRKTARDSKAWQLAKATGSAAPGQATATSAGRDGERSAADTDINTTAPPTAPQAAVPVAGEPPAEAPRTTGAPPGAAMPQLQQGKAPPKATAPAAPPPPPPRLEPVQKSNDTIAGAVPDAQEMRRAPVDSAGRARDILAGDAPLRACLVSAKTAELVVRCAAGTCTVAKFTVAADQKCVADRVGKLGLPQGTYEVKLTLLAPAR